MKLEDLLEIETRKYYRGFGVSKEKLLFEEELKDLEITYDSLIRDSEKKIEGMTPSLLVLMQRFLDYHSDLQNIQRKREILLEKINPETHEGE